MTSREMLDRAVALFNAHDWDALARLWSDDAEIRVPGGAQLRGGRDWADYNRALIGAFSDARVEVDHAIIEGNAVVQLSRMIGTHRGVFHGPRGIEAAPTGRVTVVPYAEIFWVAGDRITAVHLYLDFADVLHQMRRG